MTRGEGAVLAVVDVRVDVLGHPEFGDRVLPSSRGTPSPRSDPASATHGARVAGLAVANGTYVKGMAPEAKLLRVEVPELGHRTGTCGDASAISWAADQRADVICCAWAPSPWDDGGAALPMNTRYALDYCLAHGRGGKGAVIVFAAGNNGSDLALNSYASHPGVIAVGACNCHGKHPAYSGWGDALWCVFPSNDPRDPVGASMTYLTTAPVGSLLDGEAFYTTRFGFTSAACAAVAGICALIVSANPEATATEVKHILRDSCEKIDLEGGTYDERGHSPLYGYGRPDVAHAVRLAQRRAKERSASV